MQAKYYILATCILFVSIGCSISSDVADSHPSDVTLTPNLDTPNGLVNITSTLTEKAILTPIITVAATPTPIFKTPPPTVNPSYSLHVESLEAPNREWIAQTTFEQEIYKEYHVQFTVSRKDGTKTWKVLDYWGDGEGYTYAQLQRWSNDSQYFYFTGDRIAGGGCDFFPIDSKWQRLHVDTGQVTDFLLPLGRGHAVSPDESTIAYASPHIPLYVSLHNIKSGHEQKVSLPIDPNLEAAQAGDILWTPDGNAIILSIATSDGCNSSTLNFYLMRLDINTLDIIELVGNSKELLRPLRLKPPHRLLIRDWNGYTWWIDANNGEPIDAP